MVTQVVPDFAPPTPTPQEEKLTSLQEQNTTENPGIWGEAEVPPAGQRPT